MTDEQIRRLLRRRKLRRQRQLWLIIFGICSIVSVIGGILLGNALGSSKYESEIAIEHQVAEDTPFINGALSQIGNEGGEKFWSWYGFGSYVSWCACYVSWCEDQCGYIDAGTAPMFALVSDGGDWFENRGLWIKAGDVPSAGDLIFFDWEQDGARDHVGIVTAVVGDYVFTVEGNSSDLCRQKRYRLSDPVIYGYGHIEDSSSD